MLRRGSLRSALRFEQRLEAAGVEFVRPLKVFFAALRYAELFPVNKVKYACCYFLPSDDYLAP